MKKIVFVVLYLLLFNCDSNNTNVQYFLEKHEGTVWLADDSPYYWRFRNNLISPIEQWSKGVPDCYDYGEFNLPQINLEITDNINNKLVLRAMDEPLGHNYTITYIIDGNRMEMERINETPDEVDIDTFTFTKAFDDLDVLTLCE